MDEGISEAARASTRQRHDIPAVRQPVQPAPNTRGHRWPEAWISSDPGALVVQSIQSIHVVVARLGIAGVLGPEPRTADELSETAEMCTRRP